jgi:hypothetical protein
MSAMTESLGASRTRAAWWLRITLALLALAFIAFAVVSLSAEPAPTQTRGPGPSVTNPAEQRGDFHGGDIRRGEAEHQGFRGGVVKRG